MATITIYGDSPDVPSPITLTSWDEDFGNLGANRTSGNDDPTTVYDDPGGAVTQQTAEGIVGAGWNVSIA